MSLTQTTTGAINQMMCMDGSYNPIGDAIHAPLAFTTTGGVGNTWPGDPSNRRTILGAYAPVIAQACDNLLPDQDASLEGAGIGNWAGARGAETLTNETAWAKHGTHSNKMVTTVANDNQGGSCQVTAATSASTQYTMSVTIYNPGVADITLQLFFYDVVAGFQTSSNFAVAAGATTTQSLTKTYGTGAARYVGIRQPATTVSTWYIDAIQLEAGAVRTPFALDYRTACTMTIPTASIGLVPGQDASFLFLVNAPWAGNDGVSHHYFSADTPGTFRLSKDSSNIIYWEVGNKYAVSAALTPANYAADVNHVVIATVSGTSNCQVYLDGTAGTAGTTITREVGLNANLYIGTTVAGLYPLNGAILAALWGRVLTGAEITALSAPATWASLLYLPRITVTGLATGNAARLYDAAGNIHASAVETGGTATLTYTLD